MLIKAPQSISESLARFVVAGEKSANKPRPPLPRYLPKRITGMLAGEIRGPLGFSDPTNTRRLLEQPLYLVFGVDGFVGRTAYFPQVYPFRQAVAEKSQLLGYHRYEVAQRSWEQTGSRSYRMTNERRRGWLFPVWEGEGGVLDPGKSKLVGLVEGC